MSTLAPEPLSQRLNALEQANKVRFRRAELKRDLKAGRHDVAVILYGPPEFVQGMRVIELLILAPRIGRVKAERLLRSQGAGSMTRVGALTDRQRLALSTALAGVARS